MYDENGPAMTDFIHTIGWCSLGETERCRRAFDRGQRNQQPQFGIWTETVDPEYHPNDMGCYNFLTGAGGALQGIVHGYFGLKVMDDCLEGRVAWDGDLFVDKLEMRGLTWRGVKLDVLSNAVTTQVLVTKGCCKVEGGKLCEGESWSGNVGSTFKIEEAL